MKITLLVPDFLSGTSFLQQPLDFLYSAELLVKNGHDVDIIDCRVNHLALSNVLLHLCESDLILVTTTPCDQVQNYFLDYRYAYAVQTVNHIKKNCPRAVVAVCGAHPTIRPDLVLKEMNTDVLIIGEVMSAITTLASVLSSHSSLDCVPNIIYKCDDAYISTEKDDRQLHPVLPDDLFPAYNKVDMSQYFGVRYEHNIPLRRQNRAVVQGGRGCPFSCSFCHNYYGSQINRRSPESVAVELSLCQSQYGVEEIFFLDEVFTLNRQWVLELCERIRQNNINLELTVQTRVDCLDREILTEMAAAGVKNIWLGVESASNEVLDISKKGIHIEAVLYGIEIIRSANIEPHAFFMLGMPGETIASVNKTLKQIYDCKIPYTRSVMVCTPRYGTEYYELALKQYPRLSEHWFNLNAVKGLVANEMTPSILQKAKSIFKRRDFIYDSVCPQL